MVFERGRARPPDAKEDAVALVTGLGELLVESGIPIARLSISFRTLHPEVWVQNVSYVRGGETRVRDRAHGEVQSDDYVGSPVQAIHAGSAAIRQNLEVDDIPYPQLRDLRKQGFTDYVIHPLPLTHGAPTFASFSTMRAGGFADGDLEAIARLLPLLTLRVALVSAQLATASLLHIYLGRNAARRVLAGSVRRGTGEEIQAAIMFSDLRGFTSLSDTRPAAEVVGLLDEYFDSIAHPVEDHGGEVLKFIGDAMLAVFPTDPGDPGCACEHAIDAAEAGLDELNRRCPDLSAGFGIHTGRVLYGNIGACERLDFTVIGAAVNEASRVQGLCKELDIPLLVTDTAVDCLRRKDLVSVGSRELRGVSRPRALFTLARFRP